MTDDKPVALGGAEGDPSPHMPGVICGAKTRSGGICTQPAMKNGKCRMHGGKTPKGIGSGSFKHGRYSKALAKLGEDIADQIEDPRLVDPRRSIAVTEGILARLSEMVDAKDSPEWRHKIKQLHTEASDHFKARELEAGFAKFGKLGVLLGQGADEARALQAIAGQAENLNRQQTRYWQTALTAGRGIAPEEFFGLLHRIGSIIEEETDRDTARRILERADSEVCGGGLGLGGSE